MIKLFGWAPHRIGFLDYGIMKRLVRVFHLFGIPVGVFLTKNQYQSYKTGEAFVAAGKRYTSAADLRASGEETIWERDSYGFHEMVGQFRDIYGRKVFYIAERFPAYDYYDRVYDDRFQRYYYLFVKGKLTQISFADSSDHFYVTEDVGEVETSQWTKLKQQYWIIW